MNRFQDLPRELIDMTFNYLSPIDMAALRQCSKASHQLVNDHAPRQSWLATQEVFAQVQAVLLDKYKLDDTPTGGPFSNLLDALRSWVGHHGIDEFTHFAFAKVYEDHNSKFFAPEHRESEWALPYHQRLSSLVFSLLCVDELWHGQEAREYGHPAQDVWMPSSAYPRQEWDEQANFWIDESKISVRAYRQFHSPSALDSIRVQRRETYDEWKFHNLDSDAKLFGIKLQAWQAMLDDLYETPLFGAPIEARFKALGGMG